MESSVNDLTISVAVPRPLNQLFTYRLPIHLIHLAQIGKWAQVPFGRSITHAFIVEAPRSFQDLQPKLGSHTLKDVIAIDEGEPVFSEEILALCQWVHHYYCTPLGEVMSCAIPSATLKKRKAKSRLAQKKPIIPEKDFILNTEQVQAIQQLEILRRTGGTALLHGVTGSGKTEVYIELARTTLKEKKSVIILVPEIALTSQLHHQFEKKLGTRVGLWHSALSDGKRVQEFLALQRGEMRALIGARSAIFAPIQNLGLIVVDEEHEPGYKQEDRVRYQARDLAVVRGKMTKSLVVLGSATPSLETRERVREGRYSQAVLTQRIAGGEQPQIEIVDLKLEEKRKDIQAHLSQKVIDSLKTTLAAGEQAIIYLNRRGFAAFILCQDCGKTKECPKCSVSLTYYKKRAQLCCHICNHHETVPDSCSHCLGYHLQAVGAGTESLETELPLLIPEAKIARLDRDQITSVRRLEQILGDFRKNQFNILLGTQMLVKGHDFPNVTLVVVVLADALFRWPDFRASEKAYQILQQVSGRSGRGLKPGRVLVQAYDTEHAVLQLLQNRQLETAFLDSERELRKTLGYPPFGRLAKLRLENSDRNQAILRAHAIAQLLQSKTRQELLPLEVLGPSEAFLERAKGIYRWDLLIKTKEIQTLKKAIHLAQSLASQNKWPLVIDIDPYSV